MHKKCKWICFTFLFIILMNTVNIQAEQQDNVTGGAIQSEILNENQLVNVKFNGNVSNKEEYDEKNKDNIIQNFEIKIQVTKEDNNKDITEIILNDDNKFSSIVALRTGKYNIKVTEITKSIKKVTFDENPVLIDGTDITCNIEYNTNFDNNEKSENIFIVFLKNNFIFILALAACGIALFVIDSKKKNMK